MLQRVIKSNRVTKKLFCGNLTFFLRNFLTAKFFDDRDTHSFFIRTIFKNTDHRGWDYMKHDVISEYQQCNHCDGTW